MLKPVYNDADEKYAIRVVPAEVQPGEWYWRIVRVHHFTPEENRGMHNLFCDVNDENGQRVNSARLQVWWGDLADEQATIVIDKPANEPGTNAVINKKQVLSAKALGLPGEQLPSDIIENVHSQHQDERTAEGEIGNSWGHHSFHVVWEKTKAEGTIQPKEEPTEKPKEDEGETEETPVSLEETLRSVAWDTLDIAYDDAHPFSKYARQQNLGAPLTEELAVEFDGKSYHWQGYTNGIVYADEIDLTDPKHLLW